MGTSFNNALLETEQTKTSESNDGRKLIPRSFIGKTDLRIGDHIYMQSTVSGVNYCAVKKGLTIVWQTGQELVVSEVNICGNSHRCNPFPFPVSEYVQRVDYLLDERRFEEIIECPPGVPRYTNVWGNKGNYRLGSWQDQWAHRSLRTLRYDIDGPTDLAYA